MELINKYVYLQLIFFPIFIGLHYKLNHFLIVSYLEIGLLSICYIWIFISSFYNAKIFIYIWFITGSSYMSYIILIIWDYSLMPFLWILPIPFFIYILSSFKTAIYSSIYLLIYIIILSVISKYAQLPKYHFTAESLKVIEFFIIICFLSIMILLFYYLNKITLAKIQIQINNKNFSSIINENPKEHVEKYNEIFKRICKYMDEKEPYKDPNFSISELSSALNSNYAYVSKAIKYGGYPNFNNFLNSYRIKYIKNLLVKKKHNQYTLHYLYSEAGFTHQSTFNRAFKEIEGITPSKYIYNLKERANT